MNYNVDTKDDALVVFSEIYYNKGWNAYLDGQKVDYLRANYVLRALEIPKGKHKVEFKFEPIAYVVGNKVALFTSILLVLLLIFGIVKTVIDQRKSLEG